MFIIWRVLFITFVLGRGIFLRFLLRCFCIVSLPEAAAGGVLQVLCYCPYLTGFGILSFEDVVATL